MLDAIDTKLNHKHGLKDDLIWPSLNASTSAENIDPALSFWSSIRDRYDASLTLNLTEQYSSTYLPTGWTVFSLHLTSKSDSLLLVRHRRDCEPLIFQLPLDRLARREDDDDISFTYDIAHEELKEIIRASNKGTQNAKRVDGKDERAAWWKERKDLDLRMKLLGENMENAWLGAFKVRSTSFLDIEPARLIFRSERILGC
jgi:separase